VDDASLMDVVQTTQSGASGAVASTRQPNRDELVVSPRLGLVRSVGGRATLHASAFRAFRAPTMNELYRTGQVGQQITLANPALNSERATGVEAGARLQGFSGRLDLQATYFWTEINRPVSAVLVSQTATTMTNLRENLGQIQSQGVEASAAIKASHGVSLAVGYQFADAIVTSFSAQPSLVGLWIPQVPRESLTAQLRAQNEHLGELTIAARASGHAFDDSGNQYPLAGFFELGLSGRRSLSRKSTTGPVEAFFLIENVTNQRQQVSRTPILTLGTPIFAEAGLRLRFSAAGKPGSRTPAARF
jgi:outer membrane receptor protein involved in Fe transport